MTVEAPALRSVAVSVPLVAFDAFQPYTGFVVALAMVFGGGGDQGWSDALVQVAALPLLVWAPFKLAPLQLGQGSKSAIVLLCAILALPLLQMIPMPPSIWSVLPGRGAIASTYRTAGMTLPWLPITLDPSATWLGLLSIMPASAVFLAMLSMRQRARRVLIVMLFIVAVANVLLDMVQTIGGYMSPWRFYADTNLFRPVGLFANSNHNAAFLYSAIPFAAAWAIGLIHDRSRNRATGLIWLALLVLLLVIGVSLTLSRAGIVLLFVAALFCLLLIWRHDRGQSGRRMLAVGAGASFVSLLIAFQFGFVGLVQRVQGQGLEDMRWPVAEVTTKAAMANLPLGSGIGTFVPIYEAFAPRTLLSNTYVNHAHDDWLELFLTGGVPAMLLAAGFFVWLAASIFRLWSGSQPEGRVKDLALARAASIVIILLLLHSAMDYPLRIPTLSVLFAIACGYLIPFRKTESRETLRAQGTTNVENRSAANSYLSRGNVT